MQQIIADIKHRKVQFITAGVGAAALYVYAKQNKKTGLGWYALGGAMIGLAAGYFLDKNAPKNI